MLKLEDEVVKLIKLIGQALLKDATPDDLALMSQATSGQPDASSEFGRLQRMPGFMRMQRQLFFNLMTARPDLSGQNVRVDQRLLRSRAPAQNNTGNNNNSASPRVRAVSYKVQHGSYASAEVGDEDEEEEIDIDAVGGEPEEALDRGTIKSISRLIVDRDTAKFKTGTPAKGASRTR